MIGTNRHEVALFLSRQREELAGLDEAGLTKRTAALPGVGERAAGLIAAYRAIWPKADPVELMVLIQSDHMMRMPSIRFAEAKAAGQTGPVYMYLLAWESGALDGFVRAAHGIDVPLTMDNVASAPATADHPGAQAVADQMSEAWIAFARTGDPNVAGSPAWPAYGLAGRATMVFDVESQVVLDPRGEREAWERLEHAGIDAAPA